MTEPDARIGRRQALISLGAAGLGAALAACNSSGSNDTASTTTNTTTTRDATPPAPSTTVQGGGGGSVADRFEQAASCSITPEQIEGPFYIDTDAIRPDIREDRAGELLRVGIRVLDRECEPVSGALVEIWHCDAEGLYSGYEAASRGTGGLADTDDTRYLRGGQVSDSDGIVEFITVYPGWYRGRSVHIHVKVLLDERTALTSQVYFDDAVTDGVYRAAPYAARGERSTRNGADAFFDERLVLTTVDELEGLLGLITLSVA
jgi:protocatechuate 3,4-dioxygenase beta subunit